MSVRRVLLTADAVGGVWTYALELARGLAGRGVEVMLAVVGRPPDEGQAAAARAIAGLELAVTGLELEWEDRTGPLGAEARARLLGLERAFRPDLVQTSGFREAAAGFAAPVVLVAHSCVRTWWWACRRGEPDAGWDAYARGVRAGLAAADAVVAPSEAFLADFAATWGALRRPRVILNGLDLELPPATKRPVILAAGRLWDEAKNVAALAQIVPNLPWPVLVAGEPPRAGFGDRVRCLGRVPRPELHALMAAAAIFAAPARYEPFGLAVLEAARSGCALVLGQVPSLVEVWGDAARFVAPDDPEGLRRTLLALIEDRAARTALQAAALARSGAYGGRRMTDGYLALYAELARRTERAA